MHAQDDPEATSREGYRGKPFLTEDVHKYVIPGTAVQITMSVRNDSLLQDQGPSRHDRYHGHNSCENVDTRISCHESTNDLHYFDSEKPQENNPMKNLLRSEDIIRANNTVGDAEQSSAHQFHEISSSLFPFCETTLPDISGQPDPDGTLRRRMRTYQSFIAPDSLMQLVPPADESVFTAVRLTHTVYYIKTIPTTKCDECGRKCRRNSEVYQCQHCMCKSQICRECVEDKFDKEQRGDPIVPWKWLGPCHEPFKAAYQLRKEQLTKSNDHRGWVGAVPLPGREDVVHVKFELVKHKKGGKKRSSDPNTGSFADDDGLDNGLDDDDNSKRTGRRKRKSTNSPDENAINQEEMRDFVHDQSMRPGPRQKLDRLRELVRAANISSPLLDPHSDPKLAPRNTSPPPSSVTTPAQVLQQPNTSSSQDFHITNTDLDAIEESTVRRQVVPALSRSGSTVSESSITVKKQKVHHRSSQQQTHVMPPPPPVPLSPRPQVPTISVQQPQHYQSPYPQLPPLQQHPYPFEHWLSHPPQYPPPPLHPAVLTAIYNQQQHNPNQYYHAPFPPQPFQLANNLHPPNAFQLPPQLQPPVPPPPPPPHLPSLSQAYFEGHFVLPHTESSSSSSDQNPNNMHNINNNIIALSINALDTRTNTHLQIPIRDPRPVVSQIVRDVHDGRNGGDDDRSKMLPRRRNGSAWSGLDDDVLEGMERGMVERRRRRWWWRRRQGLGEGEGEGQDNDVRVEGHGAVDMTVDGNLDGSGDEGGSRNRSGICEIGDEILMNGLEV